MIKIPEFYVGITGYILYLINIHRQRINSKHFMLAHPIFHKLSVDTYKEEILTTLLLEDGVYTTYPLKWVKL